jgi:cytochrome b involved in lipid metabolism
MTSIKDFTKRVFGTSKIMTAVAVAMIVVSVVMGGLFVAGWVDKESKEGQLGSAAIKGVSTEPGQSPLADAPSDTATRTITMQELAQHSSANDCWIALGGSVYSVAAFLAQHPGGAGTITPYCGKDATAAFNAIGGGRGHSSIADQLKADYKIGTLAN